MRFAVPLLLLLAGCPNSRGPFRYRASIDEATNGVALLQRGEFAWVGARGTEDTWVEYRVDTEVGELTEWVDVPTAVEEVQDAGFLYNEEGVLVVSPENLSIIFPYWEDWGVWYEHLDDSVHEGRLLPDGMALLRGEGTSCFMEWWGFTEEAFVLEVPVPIPTEYCDPSTSLAVDRADPLWIQWEADGGDFMVISITPYKGTQTEFGKLVCVTEDDGCLNIPASALGHMALDRATNFKFRIGRYNREVWSLQEGDDVLAAADVEVSAVLESVVGR